MENGKVVPIPGTFTTTTATMQVAFDANTVATKRIRRPDVSLDEALAEAKTAVLPAGATPPKLTPIFGYSFCTAGVREQQIGGSGGLLEPPGPLS